MTEWGGKPPFTRLEHSAIIKEIRREAATPPTRNKMLRQQQQNHTQTAMTESLRQKLLSAEQVCKDCGARYGKYSVGVSSTWMGDCDVCGETKGCTEVRDWGYLSKGLAELGALKTEPFSKLTESFTPERKARIKEQSKALAEHLLSVGPIMQDPELEEALTASYERGEITLKLTKDEVGFLNECLDTIQAHHPSLQFGAEDGLVDVCLFEGIEQKITDLYADECVTYSLSPALKAYYEKYNEYPGEDNEKWEGFRDCFEMISKEAQ